MTWDDEINVEMRWYVENENYLVTYIDIIFE